MRGLKQLQTAEKKGRMSGLKRRILAFFLAGIMTFSMVSAEAFAASTSTEMVADEESGIDAEEAAGQEEASVPLEADLSTIDDTSTEDTNETESDLAADEAQGSDSQAEEDDIAPFEQEESSEKVELPDTLEESKKNGQEDKKKRNVKNWI